MKMRWLVALVVAVMAILGYYGSATMNPITGEKQHLYGMTPQQEVQLGLAAVPELTAKFGGLSRDAAAQAMVDRIGQQLVERTKADETDYRWEFHVLDDDETINAFALPGGQVFITEALLRELKTPAQIAGVLGHEIGHVVARHGAEHLAKQRLTQGLGGAAVIAAYDPEDPRRTAQTAAIAQAVGALVNMKFGRDDELESDRLGVRFVSEAGYDPRAMIEVMKVLGAAGEGRRRPPEFFSTHPNPDRRIARIEEAIRERFPNGVPAGLEG